MLIFVIIFNLILTIVNIYLLLKIRQWTNNLKITNQVLTNVESQINRVLNPAPQYIIIGEKGTHNFRLHLQILAHQWQLLQNILNLLIWLSHQTKIKKTINFKR